MRVVVRNIANKSPAFDALDALEPDVALLSEGSPAASAWPCSTMAVTPSGTLPEATSRATSGPAGVPVAGSSTMPIVGLKNRV
jgi:hypothetical protein